VVQLAEQLFQQARLLRSTNGLAATNGCSDFAATSWLEATSWLAATGVAVAVLLAEQTFQLVAQRCLWWATRIDVASTRSGDFAATNGFANRGITTRIAATEVVSEQAKSAGAAAAADDQGSRNHNWCKYTHGKVSKEGVGRFKMTKDTPASLLRICTEIRFTG